MTTRILHVVGARPNFMKTAPLMAAMGRHPEVFEQVLVHTGQHYDAAMSAVFFDELSLPEPDVNLGVGSGSHAEQTAQVMLAFEPVMKRYLPNWVVVVGDVNSTLACALVCAKLGVPVAHVEAGLRSGDRTMPEEINRLLTDQLADLLFTPSVDGDENLAQEGIPPTKIHRVGNVMIDTLVRLQPQAEARWPTLQERFNLGKYVLVTLHRPANVDEPGTLSKIMAALETISSDTPVLFPMHPRTRNALSKHDLLPTSPNLRIVEPVGYLDFLALQQRARLVLTDSGGVQEETTFLGVPCLTVRPNTERPVTISQGTNKLVAAETEAIVVASGKRLKEQPARKDPPEMWDGKAAERIADVFLNLM
jgi:UDP-N-acetylglucosamine 2-epimerase (non-hydrolysing)